MPPNTFLRYPVWVIVSPKIRLTPFTLRLRLSELILLPPLLPSIRMLNMAYIAKEESMYDLEAILIIAAFLFLSWGLIKVFERI